MLRDPKKPTLAPRTRSRTTRPRMMAVADPQARASVAEPSTSTKPTRRDLSAAIPDAQSSARGQFSIASARSVPVDVVSGSIEVNSGPRRRRTSASVQVELVAATRREISVRLRDQTITLDRAQALALAELIMTAFA